MLSYLFMILIIASYALATPLQAKFSSCLSSYSPVAASQNRMNVTEVFAQIVPADQARELGLTGDGHRVLRVDLVGVVGAEVSGYDNDTNKLATLFTNTKAATWNVYESTSWLCNSVFPSELPTPYYPYNTTYCPVPAGNFALNLSIPLYSSYALTTLQTEVRIVDTSAEAANLACIDIQVSPYNRKGWYYRLFLWIPVATAIGFWIVSWGARFATGWIVGTGMGGPSKKDARLRKWGTMIISGLSGERLSVSGGLLRFCTPSLKDIIFHVQFCTMLGMIAVNWPEFAYPIFARGAWSDLVWNTTLIQGSDAESKRVSAYPANYTVPAAFATQMNDAQYPLYLDTATFNPLFDSHNASRGMESFATTVGLRPQDLFGTCLAIFLLLTAAVVLISLFIWFLHGLFEYLSIGSSTTKQHSSPGPKRTSLGSSPRGSMGGKEAYDPRNGGLWSDTPNSLPTRASLAQQSKVNSPSPFRRIWFRFRFKGEAGAFHAAALYGNLIRLILIFHLPITAFSLYQLTLGSRASIVSRVFAALAFAFISVIIPAFILYRISRTASGKLYDATRTLLSLGPMYNIYVENKQMYRVVPLTASLIVGIVVGAGQNSGIAQAIIIIIVELAMLIIPGVWYPWGEGASMGAANAFLGMLRLCTMVLVMLLSPPIALNTPTNDWITYAVLILQAITFIFFLLMLITKLIEGFIRIFGAVHFDESTHQLDGGIFAAIMDLDCLNGVRGGKAAARKRRKRGSRQLQRNVSAAGSLTTQMMLDRHSQGVSRPPVVSSEVSTPFLTPGYPAMPMHERQDQGQTYFPGYAPPLGPPPPEPERLSSESRSAEGHGDAIMDAWRPSPVITSNKGAYAPPGTYVPSATTPTTGLYGQGQQANGSAPHRSFSVVRGGRADAENPYEVLAGPGPRRDSAVSNGSGGYGPQIRVSQVSHRPMSPPHNRQQSSSAVIETGTPLVSPSSASASRYSTNATAGPSRQSQQGIRPNNAGLKPPALAIPKRRSLNDLKHDPSPDSKYSSPSTKKHKKNKSSGWFSRSGDRGGVSDESDEESDDEPGPSKRKTKKNNRRKSHLPGSEGYREPLPFEDVPLSPELNSPPSASATGGGFAFFGFGKKKRSQLDEEIASQARDENKARKAVLAAESGALFAGVESPSPNAKKAFVVKRPGMSPIGGDSPTPSASPSNYAKASSTFRVKRTNQPLPTPLPQTHQSTPGNMVSSVHPSPNLGTGTITTNTSANVTPGSVNNSLPSSTNSGNGNGNGNGSKGFRVIRPPKFGMSSSDSPAGSQPQTPVMPSTTASSTSNPNTSPTSTGYPPSAFVPISPPAQNQNRLSGQSFTSDGNGGLAPSRPTRDPRRMSGEIKR
uniref:Membrane protein n=1 Tax=Kwoniella bestiolae CBS 10118 TaxID=1296100 RepID=A0A1B9G247_9TREE|nr:membrane protein [Kwoniella bestiolae CBS 10118]OCF25068.1 membrane protein [Kwoniella bestiolae CBS 10118]